MTVSTARLIAQRGEAGTRIQRAFAEVPQRWALARQAADGWAEVSQQLLGDGLHSGDRGRTTIRVGQGAKLLVRGVAATPLRAGVGSVAATRLVAGEGACLIHLPGAIVAHAGSTHCGSLRIAASVGASVLAAQILVPGRSACGETGQFLHLRLRTWVDVDGEPALYEDVEVDPGILRSSAGLGQAQALASIVWVGAGVKPDAAVEERCLGGLVATTPLRRGGFAARGLFATLGEAQWFVDALARDARACWQGQSITA